MVTRVTDQLRPVGLINPRRACAARVTVLGLSVRPSVRPSVQYPYSGTTRNKAAKRRYQRVQLDF